MSTRISFGIVLLCLSLTVSGGDWSQFRGPNGSGLAPESDAPPVRFAAGNEDFVWVADLPAEGISSPIIIGDRVFLTCAGGPHQDRLHVLCLSAIDGTILWKRSFWSTGRTMCHDKTRVAAPTPVSDGQRVMALFSSNDLICLDLEGHLLWLRSLMMEHPNASNSLGMTSSPVIVGDSLVVQIENDGDSFALGLTVKTGEDRWILDRPKGANWTSPVTWPGVDSEQPSVVLQSRQGVTVIQPDTGATIWQYQDGASTIPSCAVSGGRLFIPSNGLTALDTGDGGFMQIWQSGRLRPGTSSPVVMGKKVFIVNSAGILACGDVETGERLWQLRLTGPFSSSPVAAGGRIYLFNEKGLGQAVKVADSAGELVGTLDLQETILSTPAIAGNALYVRSDRHLWKIGSP